MPELKPAEFKCSACTEKWQSRPGPHVTCPACGSIYVRWVNYAQWGGQPGHTEEFRKNYPR